MNKYAGSGGMDNSSVAAPRKIEWHRTLRSGAADFVQRKTERKKFAGAAAHVQSSAPHFLRAAARSSAAWCAANPAGFGASAQTAL